eukprot:gene30354-37556_t
MVEINAQQLSSNSLQTIIAKYLNHVWRSLDHNQISIVVKRLSQLGILWDTLPASTQSQLFLLMRDHQSTLSLTDCAEMVFQLGKMQLNLSSRSASDQEILFDFIGKIVRDVSKVAVPNDSNDVIALTLMGLSSMSMPFLNLPVAVRKRVVDALLGVKDKMQSDHRMEIKTALQTMGVDLNTLLSKPNDFKQPCAVTPLVTLHSVAELLCKEVNKGVRWTDLHTDLKDTLFHSIEHHLISPFAVHSHASLADTVTVMSALAQSGAEWPRLPDKVRYALMVALCHESVLSRADLVDTLKALIALKLKWSSLPLPVREKLTRDLSQPVPAGKLQQLVSCMYQLTKLQTTDQIIPLQVIVDALSLTVPNATTSRACAVQLVSLAKLDYSFTQLPLSSVKEINAMLRKLPTNSATQSSDIERVLNALPLLTFDAPP